MPFIGWVQAQARHCHHWHSGMRALEAGAVEGDAAAAGAAGAAGSRETRGLAGVAGAGMVSLHDLVCSCGVPSGATGCKKPELSITMIVCAVCLCKRSKKVECAWETLGNVGKLVLDPHLLRLISTATAGGATDSCPGNRHRCTAKS